MLGSAQALALPQREPGAFALAVRLLLATVAPGIPAQAEPSRTLLPALPTGIGRACSARRKGWLPAARVVAAPKPTGRVMCSHDDTVEEHAYALDHATGRLTCIAHPPAPIPRQRDDELDTIVPAMQADA